ncbi:MAG TPA: hypothetical protein VF988_10340 [Verrucomicrobiae bacterium]
MAKRESCPSCERFAECNSAIQQIENLRYGAVRERAAIIRCRRRGAAEGRSAELHSAVSQICNLRAVAEPEGLAKRESCPSCERFAEYNSAIQQIKNLRYLEMAHRGGKKFSHGVSKWV